LREQISSACDIGSGNVPAFRFQKVSTKSPNTNKKDAVAWKRWYASGGASMGHNSHSGSGNQRIRKSRPLSAALTSSSACEVTLPDGGSVLVIVSPSTTAVVLCDMVLRQLCVEEFQSSSESEMIKTRKLYAKHWLHISRSSGGGSSSAAGSTNQMSSSCDGSESGGHSTSIPKRHPSSPRWAMRNQRPLGTSDPGRTLDDSYLPSSLRAVAPGNASPRLQPSRLTASAETWSLSPSDTGVPEALDPLDLIWPLVSAMPSPRPNSGSSVPSVAFLSLAPLLGANDVAQVCSKLRALLPSEEYSGQRMSLKADAAFVGQIKNVLACVSGTEISNVATDTMPRISPQQRYNAAKKVYACLYEHRADIMAFLEQPPVASANSNTDLSQTARMFVKMLETHGPPPVDWIALSCFAPDAQSNTSSSLSSSSPSSSSPSSSSSSPSSSSSLSGSGAAIAASMAANGSNSSSHATPGAMSLALPQTSPRSKTKKIKTKKK
jgi:hypothetical protein